MLADAGVPVGVSLAPVIPALNDHEMPTLLDAAASAGALNAFYTIVRLPYTVKNVFSDWLEANFPERKEKILGRIRESQGGSMSHAEFGRRLTGVGVWSEQIEQVFRVSLIRSGIAARPKPDISFASFRKSERGGQMAFNLES